MMKKTFIFFIIFLAGLAVQVRADEGMWLPQLINRLVYENMEKMGLHLTADEIYSVNHSSLKDAIIRFGRGCTGEVISADGLVITNHHCGYGAIQSHSSVEYDYLTDGFWARSRDEELPNEGLTATFLIRIEDVTSRILSGMNEAMTEEERNKKIDELSEQIVREATDGTLYNASVRSFYKGNEFYLFVYETFRDVRLVGAPPSSIGDFGGDTDNWMWPRHTGDFSMFRIYMAPDGTPAGYNKDNIPLKPKYFLPISLKGVERGDFAMIMGYPGSTDRYATSYAVNLAVDQNNPTIVRIRQQKLDIYKKDMDASDEVRIKYASKYARISNYWKYFIGQTQDLKRLKVAEKKVDMENQFQSWADSDETRKQKYGNVLPQLRQAYDEIRPYDFFRIYYSEAVRGCEAMNFAGTFLRLQEMLSDNHPDPVRLGDMINTLRDRTAAFFKDYNMLTDRKILASMLSMYDKDVAPIFYPEELVRIAGKYKGDFVKYALKAFAGSIFTDSTRVYALLDKPDAKAIAGDPLYRLWAAFTAFYRTTMDKTDSITVSRNKYERLYMQGLREMMPDKTFYPDANSTMRLTYGQVLDYYPADAVHYDFRTTLKGVMQKENPSNPEFIVPDKLNELYRTKDFGPYGQDGSMYVCFLTNNDITGGNSGSPVLNADGQLIGLAFDGNWEAMSGDITFEPELQRTICVDIRYVLFIIDKYAGAQNLVNELTVTGGRKSIIKPAPDAQVK
jgi:hypothetical protein